MQVAQAGKLPQTGDLLHWLKAQPPAAVLQPPRAAVGKLSSRQKLDLGDQRGIAHDLLPALVVQGFDCKNTLCCEILEPVDDSHSLPNTSARLNQNSLLLSIVADYSSYGELPLSCACGRRKIGVVASANSTL